MSELDFESLPNPPRAAVRLITAVAAGLAGSPEEGHLEGMGARLAASLSQALAPLLSVTALEPWQRDAARRLACQSHRGDGFLAQVAPLFQVPRGVQPRQGPKPFPVQNWLESELLQAARGECDAESLNQVLDALWDQLAKGMRVLEASSDPLHSTRGVHGCREALAGLQGLGSFADTGDQSGLEQGLNRFAAGYEILEAIFLDGVTRQFNSEPTPCALLNWVIWARRAEVACEAYEGVLQSLAQVAYDLEMQFSYYYGGPAQLLEQVEQLRSGLDEAQAELTALVTSESLRESALEAASQRIGRAAAELKTAAGPAGRLHCLHCGHSNPTTVRLCEACSATLAWVSTQASIDMEADTDRRANYLRNLIEACEQLQSKLLTPRQFTGVVRGAFSRLKQAQKAQQRLGNLEPLGFQALGAQQMLRSGIEQLADSLDSLHLYLVESQMSALSKGVRQLVAATRTLEQVAGL